MCQPIGIFPAGGIIEDIRSGKYRNKYSTCYMDLPISLGTEDLMERLKVVRYQRELLKHTPELMVR